MNSVSPDLSSKSSVIATCACGWQGPRRVWTLIDATRRRDLRTAAARGRLEPACPDCGGRIRHTEPVAVLFSGTRPALLLFANEDDSTDRLQELPDDPAEGRYVAFVLLPPWALTEVCRRDIDSDLRNPERAVRRVRDSHGVASGGSHEWLLTEIDWQHRVAALREALGSLLIEDDADAFRHVVQSDPRFTSNGMRTMVERDRASDPNDPRPVLALALLEDLSARPDLAFERHRQRIADLSVDLAESREAWQRRLDAATDPDAQIDVIDELLDYDDQVRSDDEVRGRLLTNKGLALSSRTAGTRRENLEAALGCLSVAIDLPSASTEEHAERLSSTATMYAQRLQGDPPTNRDLAVGLFERALEALGPIGDQDQLAATRTNLANALREARHLGAGRLQRAELLLRQALAWRSPDRNADDWSYSQINLAVVLAARAGLDGGDTQAAEDAYRAVIAEADRISEPWLVATAQLNLAGLLLPDDEWDADSPTDQGTAPEDRRTALEQAELLLLEADRRTQARPDIQLRVVRQLADAQHELARPVAPATLERAVKLAQTHGSSSDVADVCASLAGHRASRGDWPAASTAYRLAVTAHERDIRALHSSSDRSTVARARSQLARWAAHSFVVTGSVREAVETLERGRARELRRRLAGDHVQAAQLRAADPDLADHYERLTRELAAAPLEDAQPEASAELEELMATIRSIAGLEGFESLTTFTDIVAAAQPDRPLVYINPTPSGTDLIAVSHDGRIEVAVVPVTSLEIVDRVLFGADRSAFDDASFEPPASVTLAALSGDVDLAEALTSLTSWIGEHISRAIDTLLERCGAASATLVTCGPLSRIPVAGCPWGTPNKCLLDRGAFVLAPSAALHARARAVGGTEASTLTFIGNPHPDSEDLALPGADLERSLVSDLPWLRSEVVTGERATTRALSTALLNGGVVHLACHANAGVADIDEVGLVLHDADVRVRHLAAMDARATRLVTLSGCQTAVSPLDHESEAFSLAAVLLSAGSSAVVASLWSVDDVATALFMGHFYERLLNGQRAPAEALRQAQLWLRSLPRSILVDALAAGEGLGQIEDYDGSADDPALPFAHIEYWGAFVVCGH